MPLSATDSRGGLTAGIVALVCMMMLAVGCSVTADEVATELVPPPYDAPVRTPDNALPVVGPIPNASHWHAAYVVRVCDDVLPPFDSDADPLGIHSHADGIMHIHPFFEESGYERALLSHFADAMGFELRDGELVLPGGETFRDGDLCGDRPGRVFVDRWRDPDPESEVERIFENLDEIRFLADGELYQIGFAPADSFPVVPPSVPLLSEVSNLFEPVEPWVDTRGPSTAAQAQIWQVDTVGVEPCEGATTPESVLFGPIRCFGAAPGAVPVTEAVLDARAVTLNRQPAVEIRMGEPLLALIFDHFRSTQDPMTIAIEVDGFVITAPQIVRPPVSDRLVVSGGFSADTATELATNLNAR